MSALERDDLLSLRKVKESMREKEEDAIPNAKGKYIYVGYKGEFDPTKSFLDMKRLDNNAGREVYGVSIVTVMPTEFFNILESKLSYKRRFYPQGDG
eukprot:932241-Ditylum_brightwellii.AAC.1